MSAGYKPWLRLRNVLLPRLLHWKLRVYRRAGCRLYRLKATGDAVYRCPLESPACSCAVEYKAPDLMVLRHYHSRSMRGVCRGAAQGREACKTGAPAKAYRTGVLEEARAVRLEATTAAEVVTTALAEEKVWLAEGHTSSW